MWLRPGFVMVLVLLALVSPWTSIPVFRGSSFSQHAPALVVLAMLLLVPATVVSRLQRLGVAPVRDLPVPGVRLGLVAPAVLAVLVALVQHLRQTQPLGAGAVLLTVAVVLILGTDVPPRQVEAWRLASLGTVVVCALVSLSGLRNLTFPGFWPSVLLTLAWTWVVAGAYLTALQQRRWDLWSALLAVGGGTLIGVGLVPSVGSSLASVSGLLLVTCLALGAVEGMGRELGAPPAPFASRELPRAVATVWVACAAYLALLGLAALVAPAVVGGMWPFVLGLVLLGAAYYLRSRDPLGSDTDRTVAMLVAGAGALLLLVALLLSSLTGVPVFAALVAPLVLTGLLLAPRLAQRTANGADASVGGQSAPPAVGATLPGTEESPSGVPSGPISLGGSMSTASLGARLGARLIDGVIIGVALTLLQGLGLVAAFTGIDPVTGQISGAGLGGVVLVIVLALALTLFYEIGMIARTGATVGKHALKLRVVTEDGRMPPGWEPAGRRYLVQALSGIIPFGGLAVIASILMDDSGAHRGWHDKFAQTRVVSVG